MVVQSNEHIFLDNRPPVILYVSLFFLLVCIHSLGAKYFVFSYPVVPGVSSFYLVVALMVAGALWFGWLGVFASYAGCVIGAGILSGFPFDLSFYWSLADFWQALIPFLAFRLLHADPSLKTRFDLLVFITFGVLLNNLVGAIWGAYTLEIGGIIMHEQIPETLVSWFTVNVAVCGLLALILLVFLTPWMKEQELYLGT